LHDLPQREVFLKLLNAHKGKVSGLCFADEERLLSCGVDRNIKLWDVRKTITDNSGPILESSEKVCILPWRLEATNSNDRETHYPFIKERMPSSKQTVSSSSHRTLMKISALDHHSTDPLFATASNLVHIWDETKYFLPVRLLTHLT
jgi:DDB1- and CUL4-associated factor 13